MKVGAVVHITNNEIYGYQVMVNTKNFFLLFMNKIFQFIQPKLKIW